MRRLLSAQLAAGRPPQLRDAVDRLRRLGKSDREIWRLLRVVLEREIEAMLRTPRVFDPLAYARALDTLPELPSTTADDVNLTSPPKA